MSKNAAQRALDPQGGFRPDLDHLALRLNGAQGIMDTTY